mmetsp:Transcript_64506/g.106813  ORF Transcript_64506/g.106813 Transcript_64506/m.106813 type:complete len:99 (+) Transcript_64506:231-527(+)
MQLPNNDSTATATVNSSDSPPLLTMLGFPLHNHQYYERLSKCHFVTRDRQPDHDLAFFRLALDIIPTMRWFFNTFACTGSPRDCLYMTNLPTKKTSLM